TGVDMGVDGLNLNADGKPKVIDARDFTGQGDIELYEAKLKNERNEYVQADDLKNGNEITITNEEKKLSVRGINKISLKAADDRYLIGNFDESRFRNSNSEVRDLNGNGKFDDNFTAVVFKVKDADGEYWVAYLDTNADGSISDEKPLRSYSEKFDTFQISKPAGIPPFTFAINIFPDEKKLNVFYDDGGHGTHVAGIAAGYHIGKEKDFNGVAPGARMIALKIGHNTMSGGATVTESMKKAYLYADAISKKFKEPCIINMSFGIGSVLEGSADMEMFLQDLLRKNPYLYVCLSNGNNGPGLSTAGLPASSKYGFSSGAVLTKEVGRDVYGAQLDEDVILHFSSRGGETAKPDVVSPGACVSTVANWTGNDRMWGTSMASPYTAGVMSLLLSAVSQKYPDVKVPSQLLYNAVRQGAVKMKGYTYADQGAGYINAVNAFSVLEQYIKTNEYKNFEDYNIAASSPTLPGLRTQAMFLRNGLLINREDTYTFNISRVSSVSTDKFYRIFNLKSDADWLAPVQRKTYLRNQQGTAVAVRFDKSKMTEPGLYSGRISAYRDDNSKFPEFDLLANVVIPYEFTRANNYSLSWDGEKLAPARHKRYFVDIPAGTSALNVKLSTPRKGYSQVIYRLFDPDGINIYTSPVLASNNKETVSSVSHQNMKPGVYELVVHGNFTAKDVSSYNLLLELTGVSTVSGNAVVSKTEKSLTMVNQLDLIKNYELKGKLLGYQKSFDMTFAQNDKNAYEFVIRKGEESKDFEVRMSKEDFNKLTDFSVLVYDMSGKAILKDGLNYPDGVLTVPNTFGDADSTRLRMEVVPAFALKAGNAKVSIKETTNLSASADFDVICGRSNIAEFYPGVERTLSLKTDEPSYSIPGGCAPYGVIYLKAVRDDRVELEIPFLLK
ncbi:MAG: S8 family serine peptidase, partial [Syntrophothermus sp.]